MTSTKYQVDYSSDDDLDALRTAALQSLYSKKRRKLSSRSSSPTLSSISSDSLDKNDKDYRFEFKSKDIDERFPQENQSDDLLIVNCPTQEDDDLLVKHGNDRDERTDKTPSISVTVKLPTKNHDFDLRQLIKKRRTDQTSIKTNRTIELLPEKRQKKYIKSK